MTTIRQYLQITPAELDKALLESEGIEAFVSGENSAYVGVLGEIRLEVEEADAARALQLLKEQSEQPPLPDDFNPPPAGEMEPPSTRQVNLGFAFLRGGSYAVGILCILAVLAWIMGGIVRVNGVGLFILFSIGGVIGLLMHRGEPPRSPPTG